MPGFRRTRFVDAGIGVLAIVLCLVVLPVPAQAQSSSARGKITGTYSSLEYNSEGGDLLGAEIRLFWTEDHLKALVQICEGGAGEATLANATVSGDSLVIGFPDHFYGLREFRGKIGERELQGAFIYNNGVASPVRLKRGKSYWD